MKAHELIEDCLTSPRLEEPAQQVKEAAKENARLNGEHFPLLLKFHGDSNERFTKACIQEDPVLLAPFRQAVTDARDSYLGTGRFSQRSQAW
jgi:hypothetical protein